MPSQPNQNGNFRAAAGQRGKMNRASWDQLMGRQSPRAKPLKWSDIPKKYWNRYREVTGPDGEIQIIPAESGRLPGQLRKRTLAKKYARARKAVQASTRRS